MTKSPSHDLRAWAQTRETSVEIAEAIFELAKGDQNVAQKIWDEGSDEVLPLAFSKTKEDVLFWGEQTIERKNI